MQRKVFERCLVNILDYNEVKGTKIKRLDVLVVMLLNCALSNANDGVLTTGESIITYWKSC
jgi:hypothetical protein